MGDWHQANETRKGDGKISTRSHVGLWDIHHLCTDLAAAEIKKSCLGLGQAGRTARQIKTKDKNVCAKLM